VVLGPDKCILDGGFDRREAANLIPPNGLDRFRQKGRGSITGNVRLASSKQITRRNFPCLRTSHGIRSDRLHVGQFQPVAQLGKSRQLLVSMCGSQQPISHLVQERKPIRRSLGRVDGECVCKKGADVLAN